MATRETFEVIIVGAGPAGLSAGLYSKRAGLKTALFERGLPGGQIAISKDVENYPGCVDGIMGPELMSSFRAQAERFGAEFVTDDVTKVDFSQQPLRIWVGDDEYRARAVIVATGASAKLLGTEGESRLMGSGVSACATCARCWRSMTGTWKRHWRRITPAPAQWIAPAGCPTTGRRVTTSRK